MKLLYKFKNYRIFSLGDDDYILKRNSKTLEKGFSVLSLAVKLIAEASYEGLLQTIDFRSENNLGIKAYSIKIHGKKEKLFRSYTKLVEYFLQEISVERRLNNAF